MFDSGTINALLALITGVLAALGYGSLVPLVGPAVQGLLALVALGTAIYSVVSHMQKTSTIVAAGISH